MKINHENRSFCFYSSSRHTTFKSISSTKSRSLSVARLKKPKTTHPKAAASSPCAPSTCAGAWPTFAGSSGTPPSPCTRDSSAAAADTTPAAAGSASCACACASASCRNAIYSGRKTDRPGPPPRSAAPRADPPFVRCVEKKNNDTFSSRYYRIANVFLSKQQRFIPPFYR